jgi:cell division protein FtsN
MKPIARDYKRPRRQSFDLAARWREFAVGLAAGLLIAVIVFLYQRQMLRETLVDKPRPNLHAANTGAAKSDAPPDAATQEYDFYEMLPKFEVVVPEKDREVKRDQPNSPIERPGVYVLQAGSYRNVADAERVRAQLALQNVDAAVQRVAIDNDVWHRVRIGPLTDLAEVNRLRSRLRAADLNALVIRVGD